jgi:hypothetical protein
MQLKKHHCKSRINESINHNYHFKETRIIPTETASMICLIHYDQQDFPFMPNTYTLNLGKYVAVLLTLWGCWLL